MIDVVGRRSAGPGEGHCVREEWGRGKPLQIRHGQCRGRTQYYIRIDRIEKKTWQIIDNNVINLLSMLLRGVQVV